MREATAVATVDGLAPDYYRRNFIALCDGVVRQYGDLLLAEELGFLERWETLGQPAQCLYVRLVSRVGPWFRSDRLHYPEIGPLDPPLRELEQAGLLRRAEALELPALDRLYRVDEFRAAFPEVPGGRGATRPRGKRALLEAVAELGLPAESLFRRLARDRAVVAPLAVETVALLQLLFFGNRRQDLTEFVLSDLGFSNYYPYSVDRGRRLFQHRESLEEYLAWTALRDRYLELRELGDAESLVQLAGQLAGTVAQYAPGLQRFQQLVNELARDLERLSEFELAESLYACSRVHPARERRARVREARRDWAGALALCREIAAEPWCEAELDAARRMMPRLRRALGERPPPVSRDSFNSRELRLPRAADPVERAASAALAPGWRAVHYVENSLMNGLFGLAFWEQIFAPVPGAFHNAFQAAPADMYDSGFRLARHDMLEARLEALRAAPLADELLAAWERYQYYQCRWVNWRTLSRELVADALAVVPAAHLLPIWERILFDPAENRRGFPDLIALGEAPGDYRLIEVKGPGDTLQNHQKRWLRFFDANAIPAEVLRVRWSDA